MQEKKTLDSDMLPTSLTQFQSHKETLNSQLNDEDIIKKEKIQGLQQEQVVSLESQTDDQNQNFQQKGKSFKVLSLLKYIGYYVLIFIVIQDELRLEDAYLVNSSIRQWINKIERHQFNEIESKEDFTLWFTKKFPIDLYPDFTFQYQKLEPLMLNFYNKLISQVRFTQRRAKLTENDSPKYKEYVENIMAATKLPSGFDSSIESDEPYGANKTFQYAKGGCFGKGGYVYYLQTIDSNRSDFGEQF